MSQAKLTLRPPPNIDFVQGYPGIPPGVPDRPQAAVKGAIEVRVGPQGVKAKWVRVELRKIETLPGGGLTNTFFDFVGQSPISLWQSDEEYDTLPSQDFPFYIRIPESIPPSIALEKGAGVKYELIATLCIKGKKGFLKRDKHSVIATSSPIVIDKHELHSTWPVYMQPEGRKLTQEGVTLTVERTHTCFGPGDRIVVTAIVRSDSLSTVILRGFEFSLRETTVFRAGPHTTGKKGAPQVKVGNVGEQKVPVNATLYGGTQHKAELSVTVPSHHTSTTLNAARHIDITYVLIVKALMGTGKPLIIDLPVVISNWPRSVSVEAVRRIGLAPNVQSQTPAFQEQLGVQAAQQIGQQIIPAVAPAVVPAAVTQPQPGGRPSISGPHPFSSMNDRPGTANSDAMSAVRFNTAPALNGASGGAGGAAASAYRSTADEFGFHNSRAATSATIDSTILIGSSAAATATSTSNGRTVVSDTSSNSGTNTTGAGLRSRPSAGAGAGSSGNRLTVTNFADDMPEEAASQAAAVAAAANARAHQRQGSLTARANMPTPTTTANPNARGTPGWLSAEEEKKKLYERAVADVERVQGGLGPTPAVSPRTGHVDGGRVMMADDPVASVASPQITNPQSSSTKWLSAEEEKARLYNEAQAAARRLQGFDTPTTNSPIAGGSSSGPTRSASATAPVPAQLTGAALYAQAMSNVHRNKSAGNSSAATAADTNSRGAFRTADEEKEELRRYHEAKLAVERSQLGMQDAGPISEAPAAAPISYEALYGPGPATPIKPTHSVNGHASTNGYSNTPAFPESSVTSPISAFDALSEKERMRRAYEAQDAMANASNAPAYPMSPPQAHAPTYMRPVSPPMSTSSPGPANAISEKEMLRLRYESQDAAASYTPPLAQMVNGTGGPAPAPPPRVRGSGGGSLRGTLPNPRSQPMPPPSGSSQPLSAVEEKARLRAMYENQDSQPYYPSSSPESYAVPPPSPPPMSTYSAPSVYSHSPPSPPPSMQAMVPNGINGSGSGANIHHRQGSLIAQGLPPPPPLLPRPPKEYIEETREEDARTAATIQAIDGSQDGVQAKKLSTPELNLNPFTPFTPGFDLNGHMHASQRPPLPTKVANYD